MTNFTRVRAWISGGLLTIVILVLLASTFAQYQVNQLRGWTNVAWTLTSRAPLEDQIQAGLNAETRANKNILSQLLHISAPRLGLDKTFAAGMDIHPTDHVRVASNTKTFVAAAALILVEQGQLPLDASISPYLSDSTRSIFARAGRQIETISLRHLLNHSSGIADYGSSRLFQALAYVPTAFGLAWHWAADDQIWFAANLTGAGPVGSQFEYSDTNYLLVADMIAKASGKPNAGIALQDLLNWNAIGASDTFWEGYQPTPLTTRRVRHFRGAIEDTNLDVSFDQYGGGGLVMTMADLARAQRAVVRGEVFANDAATSALMQTIGTASGSGGYALGIFEMSVAGETCWAHGGRWGTLAIHCPQLDIAIARSWGQSNAGPDTQELTGVLAQLIKLQKAPS